MYVSLTTLLCRALSLGHGAVVEQSSESSPDDGSKDVEPHAREVTRNDHRSEGACRVDRAAGEPLMQEALQERMQHMRTEISGEKPTPLEVLLTERVVAGWLLVEVLEGLISAQYQRDVTAHRVPPGHIIQQSRILESATRRYLAAVRELARVRKLQGGMPVRVNTLNVPAE